MASWSVLDVKFQTSPDGITWTDLDGTLPPNLYCRGVSRTGHTVVKIWQPMTPRTTRAIRLREEE